MMPSPADFCRLATPPITYVNPCEARPLPRVTNQLQRNGLRYQKKVTQALTSLAKRRGLQLTAEPWFEFFDRNGRGQIVPDAILTFGDQTIVIEIKTTFVPVAITKLEGLYVPLITMAEPFRVFGSRRIHSLVICKHITPDAPHLIERLSETFRHHALTPVLQWLGHGPILW